MNDDEDDDLTDLNLQHLRDLEEHPGWALICRHLAQRLASLRRLLENSGDENVSHVAKLQGQIRVLRELVPGEGEDPRRSEVIMNQISLMRDKK